jgi:LiaF transmembrane domain
MNCANHPDVANVAFCRTCGKPLCANCTRDVRGVIYCEGCLAERLGALPPGMAGVVPPAAPIGGSSGPNPALAGILAGFFPFGVGAVYTGQYAKGLAHLLIFTGLIWGLSETSHLAPLLGLTLAFFIVYQIIDAVRSARAVQLGQPAPDPFGLAHAFGAGERVDTSKIPTAAVVLIGLGFIFLLQTTGIFGFGFDRIWPVLLIALGVWLFAKRQGLVAPGRYREGRASRTGSYVGPAVLVTIGALSLIENLGGPGWDRTWPVLLLMTGLAKLLDSQTRQLPSPPMTGGPGPTGGAPDEVQPPSEVKNG